MPILPIYRCNWADKDYHNIAEYPFWTHLHNKPSKEPYICLDHYPAYLAWRSRKDAAKRAVQTKRAKYRRWPANYKDKD